MKVFLSILLFFPLLAHSARVVDRIMAIVNDEIITLSDFQAFRNKIKNKKPLDDILFFNKKPRFFLNKKSELLNLLVNESILESEIKKNSLQVTQQQVAGEIRRIAKNYGISQEQLVKELKKDGQSFSEYKAFIKTRMERQRLVGQAITSKIKITDDEVLQYYLKQNSSAKEQVFEYTLSHIFFSPNKSGGHDAAIERASRVLRKLKGGENFELAAKKHSEDPNFSSGGYLGTAKAGEFNASVSRSISKLKPGQFSKVVKTPAGYSILKIIKIQIADDPKFAKAKPQIRDLLTQKAFKKQFYLWIKEKRRLAFIRFNK